MITCSNIRKEMKYYKKPISDSEKAIILILQELKLLGCTAIVSFDDDYLYEQEGRHVNRNDLDIIKLYNDSLKAFYSIHTSSFTNGIYCFMNTNADKDEKEADYRTHLLSELERITACVAQDNQCKDIISELLKKVKSTTHKLFFNNQVIDDFCLLHGDLYLGNILSIKDNYALIDFEYLRFGPPEIEWAFLLFWDLLAEDNRELRSRLLEKVKLEMQLVKDAQILTDFQIWLIKELYLPVILCSSLSYAAMNKYKDSQIIREGIIRFWEIEYDSFCSKENDGND